MKMKLLLGLGLLLLTIQSPAFSSPTFKHKESAAAVAVMSKLCTEMNFSADQKSRITEIIHVFMEEKAKILPLQETDQKAYAEKQASYFKMLKSKLSEVMMKTQLKQFLQLKPRANETDNALYALFY